MQIPADLMTTGDAARASGLSQQTIIRCCRDGSLPCFLVPGSTHRRIEKAKFIAWAAQYGIPLHGDGMSEAKT